MKSGFNGAVPVLAVAAVIVAVACSDRIRNSKFAVDDQSGMSTSGSSVQAADSDELPDPAEFQIPSSAGQRHFAAYRHFQRRSAMASGASTGSSPDEVSATRR